MPGPSTQDISLPMSGPGPPAQGPGPTPGAGTMSAGRESTSAGEAFLLRRLVAICSHLSTLASQTTELAPIVSVLADAVGSGVTVVDPALEMLACARVAGLDEITGQLQSHAGQSALRPLLTAAARNRRALTVPGSQRGKIIVIAPVLVGEDVTGYLLTLSNPDAGFTEDMRLLAIEHAAMVCGLVLGRDLVVAAAVGRARQELIEGLLLSRDRSNPELERWARHLGLDPTRQYCVLTFEAPLNRPGSDPSGVELLLARNAPGAIVANRAEELVAIVPVDGNGTAPVAQARALARDCLADKGQRPPVTGIGIGNPCAGAGEIARSYVEAQRALAAGSRMGQARTISAFADLGIHRLLLRIPEISDLRSFADEVLGGLAAEGRSTDVNYLTTLSAYFRENGSPARAGRRLHVHPNTVSYRIRRIEELTGLSFSVHRDRLMAELAVEILVGLESES